MYVIRELIQSSLVGSKFLSYESKYFLYIDLFANIIQNMYNVLSKNINYYNRIV